MAKTALMSPLGKARMGLDYVIPPKRTPGDESIAAFVGRRLGREVPVAAPAAAAKQPKKAG